ncbi:hypothetical protein GCM10029964_012310 [Kibdelosporangium lantanae]
MRIDRRRSVRVRGDDLVKDLKKLRKGRGILTSSIISHVGPALGEAVGVHDGDAASDVRRKVGGSIQRWAEDLPADLRLAVLVAYALADGSGSPYYQERVRTVAQRLNRDERTARRRIDEGIARLAEVAVTGTADHPPRPPETTVDWHTEELRTSVALDQPTPEVFETRRIVADRDELEYVDLAMTLTVPPGRNGAIRTDDLEIDIFHGGRLASFALETGDRYGFRLKLPKPLDRDETHQIGLRFRVRPDRLMAPHYVCVPRNRCVDFDLRVRFDADRLPAKVWRLNNTFQRDIDDPAAAVGEAVQLDGAGEIHTRFHELTPGLAYGIRWA